jgi:putative redox protein
MITGIRNGNLGAMLKTKNFQITAGVPADIGGIDDGPTPHEILEAALAACTIITVQMYANRKDWPLKSTDFMVKPDSESEQGTVITRDINFVGDLTEEQKQRLLEIANKCPIHKLLSGKIEIKTSLVSR